MTLERGFGRALGHQPLLPPRVIRSGRCWGSIRLPRVSTTACSRVFSSSRTFPGQSYAMTASSASAESACLAADSVGDALEERLDQEQDVLPPLPERRQVQRDHVETVEEVGPEAPFRISSSRSPLVAAITRTSTGIDSVATDRDDLALLQHAQQLHLGGRRHLTDLVQEERAAARRSELPLLVPHRAGEGSLHVPEQLALEQALRKRAAVDRRERALAPSADSEWMYRATTSFPVPLSP